MTNPLRVALTRAGTRRDAAAEALGLVGPAALAACDGPTAILLSPGRTATAPETLAAALDIALAGGAGRVTLVGPGPDRVAYRREVWGRPVAFHDLASAGPEAWAPVPLATLDGPAREVRVARPLVEATGRVVLATLRTDGLATVGLSLATLAEAIHPEDRAWLHGTARAQESLDRRWPARLGPWLRRLDRPDGHQRLSAAERTWLAQAEIHARNLVRLARAIAPTLVVVDGFEAFGGDAPTYPQRVPLGAVVAGTAPVAVDAVAARLLGVDPRRVAHLSYAEAAGLGPLELDAIPVQGDPVERLRRPVRPHHRAAILRHLDRRDPQATTRHGRRPAAGRRSSSGRPGL